MHVLMLSWEYPPRLVGGLARHLSELSLALARRDVRVTVVTAAFGEAPAFEELTPNLRVVRTALGGVWGSDFQYDIMHLNFALAAEALALHPTTPYDVVHAHDWLAAYAGETVRRATGRPLVSTIHATEIGRNNSLHTQQQQYISQIEWWLTYQSSRVVCCSTYMSEHLQAVFSTPRDKIRVVNNGVDWQRYETEPSIEVRRRFAHDDEKIVFFVGRLVREKGVQILIEAAAKVVHYHPKTRFVIAGGGDSSAHKRRVWDLGIADRFHFLGFVADDELPQLYKVADVAAVPSLSEPFGIVALEALAAGTPVVVSDVGGLSSIIRHGENGYKCYPDSPDSLGTQILHVLYAPEDAARCVRQGLEDVKTLYGWDLLAGQTEAVYEEVL